LARKVSAPFAVKTHTAQRLSVSARNSLRFREKNPALFAIKPQKKLKFDYETNYTPLPYFIEFIIFNGADHGDR
jgi:hypothetical protein